jgi:hypothetical protein
MGIVEGQYRSFRQGCLYTCGNRRRCPSMTVCQSRDPCLQLSQEGLLGSGTQDMHHTVSVCSRHPPWLWTRGAVLALDAVIGKSPRHTIVAVLREQDNFVQKNLTQFSRFVEDHNGPSFDKLSLAGSAGHSSVSCCMYDQLRRLASMPLTRVPQKAAWHVSALVAHAWRPLSRTSSPPATRHAPPACVVYGIRFASRLHYQGTDVPRL